MTSHYTYLLTHSDGSYYFGSRTCKGEPSNDKYMGSGRWPQHCKRNGLGLSKTVLSVHKTREAACIEEARLIDSRQGDLLLRNIATGLQRHYDRRKWRNPWRFLLTSGIIGSPPLAVALWFSLILRNESGFGISSLVLAHYENCSIDECNSMLELISARKHKMLPEIWRDGSIWHSSRLPSHWDNLPPLA
jgi:hypothetical protein